MLSDFLSKVKQGSGIYELLRFVLVGGLATLTDLTVTLLIFLFWPWLHENLVTTAAFCAAFFVSFFGHRYVTFRHRGSMFRFFLLQAGMLLLRNLLVLFMVTFWMRGLIPIITSMAVVTLITYFISKYKVFNQAG